MGFALGVKMIAGDGHGLRMTTDLTTSITSQVIFQARKIGWGLIGKGVAHLRELFATEARHTVLMRNQARPVQRFVAGGRKETG